MCVDLVVLEGSFNTVAALRASFLWEMLLRHFVLLCSRVFTRGALWLWNGSDALDVLMCWLAARLTCWLLEDMLLRRRTGVGPTILGEALQDIGDFANFARVVGRRKDRCSSIFFSRTKLIMVTPAPGRCTFARQDMGIPEAGRCHCAAAHAKVSALDWHAIL